jgi:hypothetical protein
VGTRDQRRSARARGTRSRTQRGLEYVSRGSPPGFQEKLPSVAILVAARKLMKESSIVKGFCIAVTRRPIRKRAITATRKINGLPGVVSAV